MADNLAALLANAAQTNADFDFGKLNKSYWEGLEQAYKQKQRSLFEGGAPTKDDGTIDWDKVSSRTLQAGGVPALGELTTLQKVMTDMGIKAGLGGMSNNVFGGPGAAPAAPPSAAPSRLVSPSVSGSSGAVADDNMEIPPRTIAAANAPPAARPAPAQPAAPPAAAQPAPTQLPPPPPVSPLVPRPVQTTPITPPQMAPQSVPLPPPRPVMAQAPAAPPQAAVQQAPPPQPPVQQPPPQAGSPQAAGMSPATEAALHAAGLVPEGRSVAQHVNLLQRAAALANSSGVRDAGKPYNDALNNIAKFIEQRSAPTDTQKDYELEVRQGYKGSFNDYQNMQQGQKLRFAVDQDTMKEIGTQAAQMVRIRPLLDEALRLSEKSYAGYAGKVAPYWAKVVSAFGINPGEMASNTEALRSIAQQLVPLVRQPGATSNYEAQLYLDAVISPELSHQARVKVGNMIVKLVDRSLAVAKIYRQNAGSPDLYDKIAELDKQKMFSPGETAFLTAAAERTRAQRQREPTAEEVADEMAKRRAAAQGVK